ncbi:MULTISPECIES: hypothetical protein [Lysobacter]|jgi:hypothetical protein|uniref:Secreted protein n=1 Tax=Lysobacter gummosus TaxID=262324 RepID=A0ABY3XAU3_9GAMM|nr:MULTISPECIES: hypothetical protein [Lysobacter]ALN93663.1 hypothetical protein LG3211_4729 [Lysobacter gummosus]UJB19690.1 hypothetical protein L1A79_00910 [Lysobacter capsici]UJQ26584.1 hypothetical protein L2D09_13950 [Lysobacter gummosus]UNP29095.1 hypothetical protein MOV92_21920 [Lysobacter gummosus]
MRKLYLIALTGLAFAMSHNAFAEIVNVTNSADGATRDSAIAAVKEKLTAACKDRGGTPDAKSFELDGEQKSSNPDVPKPFHVDARMKCDLPQS